MANTEGMSDEALSNLLIPQEVPVDMKKKQETRRKQSKFVQRRLNAPMGDRPSATIVRRSAPNSRRSSSSNPAPVPHQATQSSSSVTDKPLIGSIVERPLHSQSKPSSSSRKPSSRFASRAKLQPQANGFPSLDRPIGTFVKKKKNQQPLTRPNPDGNAAAGISKQSSASDADGILQQMSSEQVRESIQELQSSLSPETIAFLKKRGQQKQQQQANPQQQTSKRSANKPQPPQDQRKDETQEEKERIAKVLSSIKTYEDMDAAYTQEFGVEEEENQGGTTDTERAYRLLRSTSPRQTVWAARTVCHCIEKELAQGKTYAIGSTTHAAWPHPVTLPVSLRCLLDAPLTHNNGYTLHAHVLRALYGLMRLRAPRPHAIDVRDETPSSSWESTWQQHFMEDAIPTPPFGSGYPKVSAVPIATNNDGEAMAYSTLSSATSAQQDGASFLADPMWTLVSKMRLLPRLAHILEKTNASFPVEAVVAVCGILAMLSVRSPGAAAAIAQHETLMQSLLGKTVLPPNKHDEVQAPLLFMSPSVTVPTLVLLTHMARQSRTIAATIPFHKFGPSILALQDGSDSEQAQRKTLILWRTLLR